MMNDASFTFTPTIAQCAATTCPTYTVDCNPPIDWAPKYYSVSLDGTPSTTFSVPTIKDCLGRQLTVYDAGNVLRLPSGNSIVSPEADQISFTPANPSDQFATTLAATDLQVIGSRNYRFRARISTTFDKYIYMRFQIN